MASTIPTQANLLAVLEDKGYRATGPRRDRISLIEENGDSCSAEKVSTGLPDVGRATVYRTIKLLLEARTICKLALPNGTPKYALTRIGHHHHTICVKCGTVGEFMDTTVERVVRTIGSDISGEIVAHRIEFYVSCQ